MTPAPDTEARLKPLMLAALAGDKAAYRALLGELGAHLNRYFARRLANPAAADDLVQETLLAIHTRRETYDPARPLTAWVHAVARYKLIDHLRRSRLRATLPLEDDAAVFSTDDAGNAANRLDVEAALATIPPRPADLIRQVKLEGASIAEAAERAGMSESAVKVAIHRGLKALTARFSGGAR
jgi:RNA polymerase sigma-70 factor (ECF subfamily)